MRLQYIIIEIRANPGFYVYGSVFGLAHKIRKVKASYLERDFSECMMLLVY